MTTPTVTAVDWARICAAVGIQPEATVDDVVAAFGRRFGERDAARIDREARAAAIRACAKCDPGGWRLGADGLATEQAVRCDHASAQRPAGRQFGEPMHEPAVRP